MHAKYTDPEWLRTKTAEGYLARCVELSRVHYVLIYSMSFV